MVEHIGDQSADAQKTRSGSEWLACLDATKGHRHRERHAELGDASWTRRQWVGLDKETEGVISILQGSKFKSGVVDCCFIVHA